MRGGDDIGSMGCGFTQWRRIFSTGCAKLSGEGGKFLNRIFHGRGEKMAEMETPELEKARTFFLLIPLVLAIFPLVLGVYLLATQEGKR